MFGLSPGLFSYFNKTVFKIVDAGYREKEVKGFSLN